MHGCKIALRFAAITCILALTACALWFVPESRSRGHIFDEAVRGFSQMDGEDGRRQLDRVIHQTFPPGTPLIDVIGHIEDAGGVCMRPVMSEVKPDHGTTVCSYGSTHYFARAIMGIGQPTYLRAQNRWTVSIRHSDGMITGYFVENQATVSHLDRENYMDGLDRQRSEEEELRLATEES